MRLTLRVFGHEVLSLSTDEDAEDDTARDLSGGTLGYDRIEISTSDTFMGFTNGREADDGN